MVVRKVRWSRSAKADLDAILTYISERSPLSAIDISGRIYEASESLSTLSERGRVIPEFMDKTLREIFVDRFRVMYQVQLGEIIIIAVIHMSRDMQSNIVQIDA